jgi:hypothetical protein
LAPATAYVGLRSAQGVDHLKKRIYSATLNT